MGKTVESQVSLPHPVSIRGHSHPKWSWREGIRRHPRPRPTARTAGWPGLCPLAFSHPRLIPEHLGWPTRAAGRPGPQPSSHSLGDINTRPEEEAGILTPWPGTATAKGPESCAGGSSQERGLSSLWGRAGQETQGHMLPGMWGCAQQKEGGRPRPLHGTRGPRAGQGDGRWGQQRWQLRPVSGFKRLRDWKLLWGQ